MLGDLQRGSAWTRALLGLAAREIHVCGEYTAIKLVEELVLMTGCDTFQVFAFLYLYVVGILTLNRLFYGRQFIEPLSTSTYL